MNQQKKRWISTIFMVIFLFTLFNINMFAYWCLNYIEIVFGNGGKGITPIGDCIADGAGYFLESYANTMLFMKQIEWGEKTGLNYDELGNLLDKALVNIKNANETYLFLNNAAGATPYNPEVIQALRNFDYDGFREERDLNGDVFKKVKKYLVNGDIRGIYAKILSDTETIISLLEKVKAQIEAGEFPSINDVWTLNQTFSQSLLFGQYVSMVFSRLGKNMV